MLTLLINLQFEISLRARGQHVAHSYEANCGGRRCNTDEIAARHSDVRFASNGNQHTLFYISSG